MRMTLSAALVCVCLCCCSPLKLPLHTTTLRTQDRSMFPITLCATRLSGMGADMLFLGVLRRGAPVVGKDGRSIVRFWMTPNGTVMCADDTCGGCFGKSVADMTGASFSSLSTEPEAVVG